MELSMENFQEINYDDAMNMDYDFEDDARLTTVPLLRSTIRYSGARRLEFDNFVYSADRYGILTATDLDFSFDDIYRPFFYDYGNDFGFRVLERPDTLWDNSYHLRPSWALQEPQTPVQTQEVQDPIGLGELCLICATNDADTALPCRHAFCQSCIRTLWRVHRTGTCSVCRADAVFFLDAHFGVGNDSLPDLDEETDGVDLYDLLGETHVLWREMGRNLERVLMQISWPYHELYPHFYWGSHQYVTSQEAFLDIMMRLEIFRIYSAVEAHYGRPIRLYWTADASRVLREHMGGDTAPPGSYGLLYHIYVMWYEAVECDDETPISDLLEDEVPTEEQDPEAPTNDYVVDQEARDRVLAIRDWPAWFRCRLRRMKQRRGRHTRTSVTPGPREFDGVRSTPRTYLRTYKRSSRRYRLRECVRKNRSRFLKRKLRFLKKIAQIKKRVQNPSTNARFEGMPGASLFNKIVNRVCSIQFIGKPINWIYEHVSSVVDGFKQSVRDWAQAGHDFASVAADLRRHKDSMNSGIAGYMRFGDLLGSIADGIDSFSDSGLFADSSFAWISHAVNEAKRHPLGLCAGLYMLFTSNDKYGVLAAIVVIMSFLGIEESIARLVMSLLSPEQHGEDVFFEAQDRAFQAGVPGFEEVKNLLNMCKNLEMTESIRGALIPLFAILSTFGKGSFVGNLAEKVKDLASNVENARKNLDTMEDAFDTLGLQISERTKFIKMLKEDIMKLVVECDILEEKSNTQAAIFCNPAEYARFQEFKDLHSDIRHRMARYKYNAFIQTAMHVEVRAITRRMEAISAKVADVRSKDGTRPTPVGVLFHGRSDVGKSHSSSILISMVKKTLVDWYNADPEKYHMFAEASEWTVWNEQNRDEYDTGYEGQQIHYVDDGFMDQQCRDHSKYISFISNTRVGSVQAALSDKGKAYRCKLVIVNCNTVPQQSVAITNLQALYNRFLYYQVHANIAERREDCSHMEYYPASLPGDIFPVNARDPVDRELKCRDLKEEGWNAPERMTDVVTTICQNLYKNYVIWEHRDAMTANINAAGRVFQAGEPSVPLQNFKSVEVVSEKWKSPVSTRVNDPETAGPPEPLLIRISEPKDVFSFVSDCPGVSSNFRKAWRMLRVDWKHPAVAAIAVAIEGTRVVTASGLASIEALPTQLHEVIALVPDIFTVDFLLKNLGPGGCIQCMRPSAAQAINAEIKNLNFVYTQGRGNEVVLGLFHGESQTWYYTLPAIYFMIDDAGDSKLITQAQYVAYMKSSDNPMYRALPIGIWAKWKREIKRGWNATAHDRSWWRLLFMAPSTLGLTMAFAIGSILGRYASALFMFLMAVLDTFWQMFLYVIVIWVIQKIFGWMCPVADKETIGDIFKSGQMLERDWGHLDHIVVEMVRENVSEWVKNNDLKKEISAYSSKDTKDVEYRLGFDLVVAQFTSRNGQFITEADALRMLSIAPDSADVALAMLCAMEVKCLNDIEPNLIPLLQEGREDVGFSVLGRIDFESQYPKRGTTTNGKSPIDLIRPSYSFEGLQPRVIRVDANIFDVHEGHIVHCVDASFGMNAGLAEGMCKHFPLMAYFRDLQGTLPQRAIALEEYAPGCVAGVLNDGENQAIGIRCADGVVVWSLVVKNSYPEKTQSGRLLEVFGWICKTLKGQAVCMPVHFGCGMHGLHWPAMIRRYSDLGVQHDVTILVHDPTDKDDRFYSIRTTTNKHKHVCSVCRCEFEHSHPARVSHRNLPEDCPNPLCPAFVGAEGEVLNLGVPLARMFDHTKNLVNDAVPASNRNHIQTTFGSAISETRTNVFLPNNYTVAQEEEQEEEKIFEGVSDRNAAMIIAKFVKNHLASVARHPSPEAAPVSNINFKSPYGHELFGWFHQDKLITPAHLYNLGDVCVAWSKERQALYPYICSGIMREDDLCVWSFNKGEFDYHPAVSKQHPGFKSVLEYVPWAHEYGDATRTYSAYQFLPEMSMLNNCQYTYKGIVLDARGQMMAKDDILVTNLVSTVPTGPGDCGSPLFVANATAPRKLVGMHHIGDIASSCSVVITKEKVEALLALDLGVRRRYQGQTHEVVLVTGGVASGIGKGVVAANIASMYQNVSVVKLDPYLNVDASDLSPDEHGEGYVLEDGSIVDLDFGTYERAGVSGVSSLNSITAGKLYQWILRQNLGGSTKTMELLRDECVARLTSIAGRCDCLVIELGGTVGESSQMIFVEALRLLKTRVPLTHIHVTYLLQAGCLGGFKTKPAQLSIQQASSIAPVDGVVLRSENEADPAFLRKAAGGLKCVGLPNMPDLRYVRGRLAPLLNRCELDSPVVCPMKGKVRVAVIGKYRGIDAYHSVCAMLRKAGMESSLEVTTVELCSECFSDSTSLPLLQAYDAVVLCGGYGSRGFHEMVSIAQFCVVKDIPLLGICYGFQAMVVAQVGGCVPECCVKGSSLVGPIRERRGLMQLESPVFGSLNWRFRHSYGINSGAHIPGFRTIGVCDGIVAAIVSDSGRQVGVQFHPECGNNTQAFTWLLSLVECKTVRYEAEDLKSLEELISRRTPISMATTFDETPRFVKLSNDPEDFKFAGTGYWAPVAVLRHPKTGAPLYENPTAVRGNGQNVVSGKGRTKFQTPFFGTFDVDREPSVLVPSDPRVESLDHIPDDGFGMKNLLVHQTNLYQDVPTSKIDVSVLSDVVDQLIDHFLVVMGGHDIGACDVVEAITGNRDIPHYDPMNLNSSNGLPWTQMGSRKGHSMFQFGEDGSLHVVDAVAVQCMQAAVEKIEFAKSGLRTFSIWKNCLKDELRPHEKVRLPKTRLFVAAPRTVTIAFRMLFGRFKGIWTFLRDRLWHSVGINVHSYEWARLRENLVKFPHIFDADYEAFDKRELAPFIWAAGKVVCDTITTVTGEVGLYEARLVLWEEQIYTLCSSFDNVCMKLNGNPSGSPFTTVLNCIVHLLYMLYCFWKLVCPSLQMFKETVFLTCFGDDGVYSVSHLVWDTFNFETCKEVLLDIGQIITPGEKNLKTEKHEVAIGDVVFLKRKFLCYGRSRAIVFCPLKKDSIEGIFEYSAVPIGDILAWKATLLEVMLEAVLWGSDYYNHIRTTLIRATWKFGSELDSFRDAISVHLMMRYHQAISLAALRYTGCGQSKSDVLKELRNNFIIMTNMAELQSGGSTTTIESQATPEVQQNSQLDKHMNKSESLGSRSATAKAFEFQHVTNVYLKSGTLAGNEIAHLDLSEVISPWMKNLLMLNSYWKGYVEVKIMNCASLGLSGAYVVGVCSTDIASPTMDDLSDNDRPVFQISETGEYTIALKPTFNADGVSEKSPEMMTTTAADYQKYFPKMILIAISDFQRLFPASKADDVLNSTLQIFARFGAGTSFVSLGSAPVLHPGSGSGSKTNLDFDLLLPEGKSCYGFTDGSYALDINRVEKQEVIKFAPLVGNQSNTDTSKDNDHDNPSPPKFDKVTALVAGQTMPMKLSAPFGVGGMRLSSGRIYIDDDKSGPLVIPEFDRTEKLDTFEVFESAKVYFEEEGWAAENDQSNDCGSASVSTHCGENTATFNYVFGASTNLQDKQLFSVNESNTLAKVATDVTGGGIASIEEPVDPLKLSGIVTGTIGRFTSDNNFGTDDMDCGSYATTVLVPSTVRVSKIDPLLAGAVRCPSKHLIALPQGAHEFKVDYRIVPAVPEGVRTDGAPTVVAPFSLAERLSLIYDPKRTWLLNVHDKKFKQLAFQIVYSGSNNCLLMVGTPAYQITKAPLNSYYIAAATDVTDSANFPNTFNREMIDRSTKNLRVQTGEGKMFKMSSRARYQADAAAMAANTGADVLNNLVKYFLNRGYAEEMFDKSSAFYKQMVELMGAQKAAQIAQMAEVQQKQTKLQAAEDRATLGLDTSGVQTQYLHDHGEAPPPYTPSADITPEPSSSVTPVTDIPTTPPPAVVERSFPPEASTHVLAHSASEFQQGRLAPSALETMSTMEPRIQRMVSSQLMSPPGYTRRASPNPISFISQGSS